MVVVVCVNLCVCMYVFRTFLFAMVKNEVLKIEMQV